MEQIRVLISEHWKFLVTLLLILILLHFAIQAESSYRFLLRPMITGILIAFYISNVKYQNNIFNTALIFALLGDVFFMFWDANLFRFGIVSYGIMYLLISISNRRYHRNILSTQFFALLAPILLFLYFIYSFLQINSHISWSPLFVSIALMLVTSAAILRDRQLRGYRFAVVGSLCFAFVVWFIIINWKMQFLQSYYMILVVFQSLGIFLFASGFVLEQKHLRK